MIIESLKKLGTYVENRVVALGYGISLIVVHGDIFAIQDTFQGDL